MTDASTDHLQEHTPAAAVAGIVADMRAAAGSGLGRALPRRRQLLERLGELLVECEDELVGAVETDLGRDAMATFITELAPVRSEVRHSMARLADWAAPRRLDVPTALRPGKASVEPQPKGVVLVIGAWNFPLLVTLQPVASALAAGNAVVLKPSELAPETSTTLARLLPAYLGEDLVRVVTGGVDVSTALLAERFDHICFTGSTTVGRLVAEAAARHLTPTTLELGGKCPVIVAADARLEVAARRIAWAKAVNLGQACVAPDYVLVESRVRVEFESLLEAAMHEASAAQPARVVSRRHLDRLVGLLDGCGGTVHGGRVDADGLRMMPALVTDPDPGSDLMQEEIFGPILPLLEVADVAEAVEFVTARPHPLALYVFTESDATAAAILEVTPSGTAVVNHLMQHLLVPDLPFGGVGDSGMGAYHGRVGFDTFSHLRGVLRRPTGFDPTLVYPPYGPVERRLLRRMLG